EFQIMLLPYGQVVNLFDLIFALQRILIIVVAISVMILLYLFLKKTYIGSAIIAIAQNREGAFLVGIKTNKVAMITFLIAGSLAAIASSLTSTINLVFPGM